MKRGSSIIQWNTSQLTSNHHHRHSEDLLSICGRSDVPKTDTRQAGHCEVKGRYVHRVLAGPAFPPSQAGGVEAIRRPRRLPQLVEPAVHPHAVGVLVDDLVVSDAVPDAGQPVGRQAEHANQQDQDSSPVLNVVVQLASHTAQPQQSDHFEGAEETADTLREMEKEGSG